MDQPLNIQTIENLLDKMNICAAMDVSYIMVNPVAIKCVHLLRKITNCDLFFTLQPKFKLNI